MSGTSQAESKVDAIFSEAFDWVTQLKNALQTNNPNGIDVPALTEFLEFSRAAYRAAQNGIPTNAGEERARMKMLTFMDPNQPGGGLKNLIMDAKQAFQGGGNGGGSGSVVTTAAPTAPTAQDPFAPDPFVDDAAADDAVALGGDPADSDRDPGTGPGVFAPTGNAGTAGNAANTGGFDPLDYLGGAGGSLFSGGAGAGPGRDTGVTVEGGVVVPPTPPAPVPPVPVPPAPALAPSAIPSWAKGAGAVVAVIAVLALVYWFARSAALASAVGVADE